MTALVATRIENRDNADQVPLVVQEFVVDLWFQFRSAALRGALDQPFPSDTAENLDDQGTALTRFKVTHDDRAADVAAVLESNAHLLDRFRERETAERVIADADSTADWFARWRANPADEALLVRAEWACDALTPGLRKALKRGQSPGRNRGR